MKLFVTGGMGFMGSNFIRHIYRTHPEDSIINFDALTYAGNPENLTEVIDTESRTKSPRYSFVEGDIVDPAAVRIALERYQPDVIVNFAAESHVDRSLHDSLRFVRSNVMGVQNLLQQVREKGIRFLQISTDEIYGDVPEGKSTEESRIAPTNPYAASKAAADLLVQSYVRTYSAPALIVRGSNNFGTHQYPEKLIPLAITNMIEEKPLPVHGSGKHIRTWLHTQDFTEAVDLVIRNAKVGSIYNIAGNERTNIEVIEAIARMLQVDPKKVIEHVPDRPGADMRYAPHAEKIERELGWRPKRHIDDTLLDIVRWYQKNEDWWKKIKEKSEFTDHYERQKRSKY